MPGFRSVCTSTEEAEEAPASSFFIFSRYIYRLTEKRVWRELERGRGGGELETVSRPTRRGWRGGTLVLVIHRSVNCEQFFEKRESKLYKKRIYFYLFFLSLSFSSSRRYFSRRESRSIKNFFLFFNFNRGGREICLCNWVNAGPRRGLIYDPAPSDWGQFGSLATQPAKQARGATRFSSRSCRECVGWCVGPQPLRCKPASPSLFEKGGGG